MDKTGYLFLNLQAKPLYVICPRHYQWHLRDNFPKLPCKGLLRAHWRAVFLQMNTLCHPNGQRNWGPCLDKDHNRCIGHQCKIYQVHFRVFSYFLLPCLQHNKASMRESKKKCKIDVSKLFILYEFDKCRLVNVGERFLCVQSLVKVYLVG